MEVTFNLCNEVLKKFYGKPEDVYPLYLVMCVLNGVLSLTSVLGNISIIFALKKTSSIPLSTRILLQISPLVSWAILFASLSCQEFGKSIVVRISM